MTPLGAPMGRRQAIALGLGWVVMLGGCASGSGGEGGPRRSANVITYEEIATIDAVDCYQLIQRLRPAWFRTRTGTAPALFLNEIQQPAGVDRLRSLPPTEVEEIRYLDANNATTRFGTGYVNGAILVETRNR